MDGLHLELRSQVDDDEWQKLLAQDELSHAFHRPAFSRIVQRHQRQWQSRWIEARRDGVLVAGAPCHVRKRLGMVDVVSGWGGSYGGAVAAQSSARSLVIDRLCDHRSWRRRHLELVWGGPTSPHPKCAPLATSVLELGGIDDFEEFLLERFPKNRRNECARSTKRGLRIDCDRSGRYVDEVWEIYRAQCERWKSPPVARGIWSDLLEAFDEVLLFVALDERATVVGGHLCVELPSELFAWLGTTRRMERVFPSSLLIREEARHAHGRGLARLNLGSSMGLGGVQNYKQLLGAHPDCRWILRQSAWWWPK